MTEVRARSVARHVAELYRVHGDAITDLGVLRRMTRRTSGSRVQQAREKAMQRAY